MSGGALDRVLLGHCAPTLAGLKSASMICLPVGGEQGMQTTARWREMMQHRGVEVQVLRSSAERTLIYLYRGKLLLKDWEKPGTADFLRRHDYEPKEGVAANVERLKQRIAEHPCFPHEIGLFLGYPLEDVQGFIDNGGRNYGLCGCWKVYGDVEAARACFARYRKCVQVYLRCYQNGQSLTRLTVAG